jgi:hypothetical protein
VRTRVMAAQSTETSRRHDVKTHERHISDLLSRRSIVASATSACRIVAQIMHKLSAQCVVCKSPTIG